MLLTAVRALRFDGDPLRALETIPSRKWPEFLALCDEAHISLALAARCGEAGPAEPSVWFATRSAPRLRGADR